MSDLPACAPGHSTPAGGENVGITIEDNQDRDCFSLRYVSPDDPDEWELIHICDWPALKAAIDQHQRERGGRTEISDAEAGQLLAVATLYADAFESDEAMSLTERMRLQEIEDILSRHGRRY